MKGGKMLTYPSSKISEILKFHTKTLEKGLKSQMKIMEKEIIEATNVLLQEQNIEEDKISPIGAVSHMESEREYDDEDKLEKAEPPIKDEDSMKTKFTEAINKKDAKGKKKKIKKKDKSKKNKIKKKKKEKKKIKKKEKLKKKKSVKKNKKHKK